MGLAKPINELATSGTTFCNEIPETITTKEAAIKNAKLDLGLKFIIKITSHT